MLRRPVRRTMACIIAVLTQVALLTAVGSSSPASGATHPVLHRNGDRATFAVTGQGRVRITARAAYCKGFPLMRVWIDGKLDRTVQTTRRSSRVYLSAKSYTAGKHRVTVIMRRDAKVTKRGKVVCNRRVKIMKVATNAPVPLAAPLTNEPLDPSVETRPGDEDGEFTLAVIGDTQAEVLPYAGTRFRTRTQWLVNHREAEDIRFVAHTGDVVNWGWLEVHGKTDLPAADTYQYGIADTAMAQLTAARIPWQASIGNHDTRAVKGGGSSFAPTAECAQMFGSGQCKSALLHRGTQEFNRFFTAADFGAVAGAYEVGKVDNTYSTFTAVGRRWLVLNLEYYPRAGVVAWANGVVTAHPDHNVIVQTHSYLSGTGTVAGSNLGAGTDSTSPARLKTELIDPHPNIKIVISGHTGLQAERTDSYATNKVVSFLGNENKAFAVTRLIRINPAKHTIRSDYWVASTAERDQGANPLNRAATGSTNDGGFGFE